MASTSTLDFLAEGLCAQTDPEAFYPEFGHSPIPGKRVCRACPVRAECLEYALTHDERFGVWGGLTAQERAKLRRHRALPTRVQRARSDKRVTAQRMYAQGRSKTDIARVLRLSGATLNAYLTHDQADLPSNPKGGDQR
jgi:WhiB family redox-sensing transcriptional regulator